jgi:hypothetical protein
MFCRQVGLVQLAVVGGHLDTAMLDRDQQGNGESREEEQQLRVLILDNRGQLFLWQDTATHQLTRCTHSIKFMVHINAKKIKNWKYISHENKVHNLGFVLVTLLAQFMYCDISFTSDTMGTVS